MGSCAGWWAAVAAYGPCFLKLLDCLGDELLRVGPSLSHAFLSEMCREARLQVVPKRLPCDLGKVGGPPGESPRALPEEGAERAFLCDRGRRPLDRRGSWRGVPGGACLLMVRTRGDVFFFLGTASGRPLQWHCVRIRARSRGASFCRIGRRARRPPRARLGGSLLEGH